MQIQATPVPGLSIIENFISDSLHDRFVAQMQKGKAVETKGHEEEFSFPDEEAFDKVFNCLIQHTFKQLNNLKLFPVEENNRLRLSYVLIGYKKEGYITRHIDSPLVSGETVVVLSFNSPIVIHFYSEKGDKKHYPIYIKPKSLYIMTGEAKKLWSHEILPNESYYNNTVFERVHRYAMLLTQPGPLSESIIELEIKPK